MRPASVQIMGQVMDIRFALADVQEMTYLFIMQYSSELISPAQFGKYSQCLMTSESESYIGVQDN